MRLLAQLAGIVLIATTSFGQVQNANGWQAGGWAEASFGQRVVTGHITGGPDLDAVLLDDGTPGLMVAPEAFLTRIDAPLVVNDMTLKPLPAQDNVLTVGASGLVELSWDTSTQQWATTVHESSLWSGARVVQLGDLDHAGELDAVALGPGASAVLVMNGVSGSYGSPSSFTTTFPAYGLELMDWDGDGTDEIIAITDFGVEVYEPDGSIIPNGFLDVSYSQLITTVIADAGGSHERLAMVVDDPVVPGRQWVVSWDKNGIDGPTFIGDGYGVHCLQAADWDLDDDDDLLLSITQSCAFLLIKNKQGTTTPSFETFPTIISTLFSNDENRNPAWNHSSLGLGDFDHDGDIDALTPAQGNYDGGWIEVDEVFSEVPLVVNTEIDHDALKVSIFDAELRFVSSLNDHRLSLDLLSGTQLPTLPGSEELVLVYSAWHLDDIFSSTDASAFASGTQPHPDPVDRLSLLLNNPAAGFPDIYAFRLRQAVKNIATGSLTAFGPSLTAVYSSNDEDYETINGLPTTNNGIPAMYTGSHGTGQLSGGVGSGPRVPPTSDGEGPYTP